jgi:hypothetical protein
MEFRLSDDQFELQDAVRKFCDYTRPIGGVAERVGGLGDRSSWRALVDLGSSGFWSLLKRVALGSAESKRRWYSSSWVPIWWRGPLYGPPSRHLS